MNKFNNNFNKILNEIRTVDSVISARKTNEKIFKYTANDVIKELITAKNYANKLTNKEKFVTCINQILKEINNRSNLITAGEFSGQTVGRTIFLLKEEVRKLYDSEEENEDVVMHLEITLQDAYRKEMKRKI
jgi:hypothetical protein